MIGITGRRFPAAALYPANAKPLERHFVDAYFTGYANAVKHQAGLPIHLMRVDDAQALVSVLDGLILGGGLDVDPDLSGAGASPASTGSDREADRFEMDLALAAIGSGIPVLGICRGLEVLNVALGGTLVADVDNRSIDHNDRSVDPSTLVHGVDVAEDSKLASVYGSQVRVNSFHHQAIDRVGDGLRVVGRAEDGTPEAIELDTGGAIGVQWHPEMHAGPDPIFAWVVREAGVASRRRDVAGRRGA